MLEKIKESSSGVLKGIGYYVYYIVVKFILELTVAYGILVIAQKQGIVSEELLLEYQSNHTLIVTLVSLILMAAFFLVAVKVNNPEVSKAIKLTKIPAKKCILPCIMMVGFEAAYTLADYASCVENEKSLFDSLDYFSKINPILGIVLFAVVFFIVIPTVESIIFFGIIFTRTETSVKPIVAIAITSILYGLADLVLGNYITVIFFVILGIILGYVFYKTQSLITVIAARAIGYIVEAILLIIPNITNISIVLIILFAIVLVGSTYLFIKETSCQTQQE